MDMLTSCRRFLTSLGLIVTLLVPSSIRARAGLDRATLPNVFPRRIAVDSAGNLWFMEDRGIERMTPAGTFTLFPVGGMAAGAPSGIFPPLIIDAYNTVWFTTGGHIARITGGKLTLTPVPAVFGNVPIIALADDGSLWALTYPLVKHRYSATLTQISPDGTLRPRRPFRSPWFNASLNVAISYLAPAPDGSLWFTEIDINPATYQAARSFVGSIDPRSLKVTRFNFPTNRPGDCPAGHRACIPEGMVVRADGTAWFGFSSGAVGHVALHAPMRVEQLPDNPIEITALALAPNGTIAVGSMSQNLCQITPANHASCIQVISRPDDFEGLAYDRRSTLWFTATCSNAIGHIDSMGRVSLRHIPGTAAHTDTFCPPVF